jgi:hypothetical protein
MQKDPDKQSNSTVSSGQTSSNYLKETVNKKYAERPW